MNRFSARVKKQFEEDLVRDYFDPNQSGNNVSVKYQLLDLSTTIITQFTIPPNRGLSTERAADHCGHSTSRFREMVGRGDFPQPYSYRGDGPNAHGVWDVDQLDRAISKMSNDLADNDDDGWLKALEKLKP